MKKSVLDSLLWFATACALLSWLGSDAWFYKADGPRLVLHLRDSNPIWPQHPWYLPIVIALRDATAFLELSPFRVAMLASSLGTAIGIASCRVAFACLGATRRAANLATLLVATCPAVVLFGSVVEIHGVFFAFAGLAFASFAWADARCAAGRAPDVQGALAGLATGVATGVHASGILMPAMFCPWLLARATSWRLGDLRIRAALDLGLVHAVFVLVVLDPFGAREFVAAGFGRPQGIEYLPSVAWNEWLFALAPCSVVAVLTILGRRTRREALAYVVAVIPYCVAAMYLLVGEPEFGAYLLPLAIFGAWLCTRALAAPDAGETRQLDLSTTGPVALALISVVAALGVTQYFQPPPKYRGDPSLEVPAAMTESEGIVLIGHPLALEYALIRTPALTPVLLDAIVRQPPDAVRAALPMFDATIQKHLDENRAVWIDDRARLFLDREPDAVLRSGRVLLQHLESRYLLGESHHSFSQLRPK